MTPEAQIMTVAEIGEAESDLIVDPPYFASVNGRRLLDSHEALRERAQAAEAELRALHASRDALQRERDELAEQTRAETLRPWKDALLHAAIVDHILNADNQNDPKRLIADLIQANVQQALDPAISEAAQSLIATGAHEADTKLRRLRAALAILAATYRNSLSPGHAAPLERLIAAYFTEPE